MTVIHRALNTIADPRPDFEKIAVARASQLPARVQSIAQNKRKQREQACKPNFVPREPEVAIIRLAPALLPGSSDLPESSLL